jgi:hypothetical protein
MAFSVSLTAPGGTPPSPIGDVITGEPEDYSTSVMRACEDLSAGTTCRFVLGGFGKADWALDLGYDLSTFVEELPDLASAVRAADTLPTGARQRLLGPSSSREMRECRRGC